MLEAIVKRVPPPTANELTDADKNDEASLKEAPLRALIYDSLFESYRGVITSFRVLYYSMFGLCFILHSRNACSLHALFRGKQIGAKHSLFFFGKGLFLQQHLQIFSKTTTRLPCVGNTNMI